MQTVMKTKSKGQIATMWMAALGLVVLAFVLAIGGNILTTLQSTQTAGTVAANVTGQGLSALGTFGSYLAIVALVIVGSVVITILIRSFGGVGRRG